MKRLLGPLAVFVAALLIFAAVLLTRPAPLPAPTPVVTRITATPGRGPTPTIAVITPAPTISIQNIDRTSLSEALIGAPKKINPLLAGYNRVDRDLSALIFEGLMTTDSYGAPIPDLAAAPPRVSSDGLTYVVTTRTDVLWQDGLRFSADDVIFTIHLMQDNAFPGQPDLRAFWQTVEMLKVDDTTIRFELAQPLAAFTDYLRIGILPEHVLRGTNAADLAKHPFNLDKPIGTGPYQFDGWIGSGAQVQGVRLKRAASYASRPEGKDGFAFDDLVFRFYAGFNEAVAAFQRGEVFTIGEIPVDAIDQVSPITQLTVQSTYKPAFGTIIYNWRNDNVPFFRDIHMRQALARAVDRQAIVDKVMARRAVLADSPILPNSWAYDRGVQCSAFNPFNLDSAKAQLSLVQVAIPDAAATQDSAQPTLPPTRTPDPRTPRPTLPPLNPNAVRFTLLVRDDPSQNALAAEVVAAWSALGINVQTLVADTQTYNNRLRAGEFEAALTELNLAPGSDPDPYSLWRQVPADGGLNFGGMNDRILSEIMEAARRESANGVHRAELYRQFQRAFCERVPALLLYDPVFTYGIDARIQGVQLGFMADPTDRFRTIQAWHFGGQ